MYVPSLPASIFGAAYSQGVNAYSDTNCIFPRPATMYGACSVGAISHTLFQQGALSIIITDAGFGLQATTLGDIQAEFCGVILRQDQSIQHALLDQAEGAQIEGKVARTGREIVVPYIGWNLCLGLAGDLRIVWFCMLRIPIAEI